MDLKKAVFYGLLIDRFSRGKELDKEDSVCRVDQFYGGTLKGITERLDYLKELGVDIIVPTPFNKGIAYHGYHTTDLLSIDPRFGTFGDLKILIAEAHKRDMKIIMDWTINHVSSSHPFFVEALENSNSKYRKWFYFGKHSNKYKSFLGVYILPKLNLDYPDARKYILDATRFWLKFGIDGMRLDHVIGISHNFWKEFSEMVKSEFPDRILVGEAVKGHINWFELKTLKIRYKYLIYILCLLRIHPNEIIIHQYIKYFDAMLDFRFRDIVDKNLTCKKPRSIRFVKFLLKFHYKLYPKNYPLIAVLDNPDLDRFIFRCKGNFEKYKEGVSLQFSQDNPVSIYSGSEVGISQEYALVKEVGGDFDVRRPMPWNNINPKYLDFYKKLICERNKRF